MRTLLCILVAFGLALAVSAQKQPAAKAQGIKPLDVPLPALQPGQQPNFIVVVTDDQGWDDIGRNNPRYVHTPNLDRFIQGGTFFDNYYVTPQCAQSRAAMLTGRYPARVGTMLVNGAWDFINSYEVTGAKLLGSQGYATAQFGKWHNSEVQGYEPWSPMVGFKKADIPVSNDGTSNMRLMRTNGTYTAAKGDIERVLLSKMLRYLGKRDEGAKPFYIYYAPHSIHLLYEKVNGVRQTNQIRFSPAEYKTKYHNDPHIKNLGLSNSTIDAWAALEYLDDVLGSLFDHLKSTGLDKTTYVMVMSDNGGALMRDERGPSAAKRMPSGMKGDKSTIWEGAPATKAPAPAAPAAGTDKPTPAKRNSTKAAAPPTTGKAPAAPSTGKTVPAAPAAGSKNPAVPRTKAPTTPPDASSDNTQDPTAAAPGSEDVAAVAPPPRRIVGRGGSSRSLGVARGSSMASPQQFNRMLFFMGPHCWDANAVPILGPNRQVLRPQPLFNFKTGGMLNVINGRELPADKKKPNPGFEVCMAVRHREFKWVGLTDKVYWVNGTHKEERSTEVAEPQATALRNIMRSAAEKWWQSVIMEPHSLEKPIFYLGLGEGLVTNMLVSGAHERTPAENIRLIPNGAAGFKAPGDRICFQVKVMSPGTYDVVMFYTSTATATLKLSIGTYASILAGTANSLTTTLPAQSRIRGLGAGAMVNLTATGTKPTEACLQLISSITPGKAVFNNLANIRFTKRQPWQATLPASRKPNQPVSHHGFGASIDSFTPTTGSSSSSSSGGSQGSGVAAAPMAVPVPGLDMSNPANSWLADVAAPAAGFGKVADKWEALRLRNAWPDGQGAVFESMYSPYNAEDILECSMCTPEV
ncbi:hypothetical protein OEZ85_007805 [Tetradesmus obliquus]|uniref:Sulfatase N-terminal domain-containing protein n=1 Tax=Tetradesmus obliquus TaxID=3088 RepID=A0ABY8TH17_TETOB|nr:hypothetical protein OEZ85_007805 [Tetradesmus obliquus]